MFQYRTQLELPPNATDLGNGTKIYLSALSPSERNHFTTGTLNLTHVAGREGLSDLFSMFLIGKFALEIGYKTKTKTKNLIITTFNY